MLKSINNLRRVLVAVLAACVVLAAMPIVSFSAGETGGPVVNLLKDNEAAAEEQVVLEDPPADEVIPPAPSAVIFGGGAVILGRPAETPAILAAETPTASGAIITGGAMVIGAPAAAPVAAAPEPVLIEADATATDATPSDVTPSGAAASSGEAPVPYSAVIESPAKKENSGSIIVPSAVVILPYSEPIVEKTAEAEEPPMAPLAKPPADEPDPIVVADAPKAKAKPAAAPVLILSDGEVPYSDMEAPGQGVEDQLLALGMGLAIAVAGILVMKRSR